MSTESQTAAPELNRIAEELPPTEHSHGLFGGTHPLETPEQIVDRIEMIGEEEAAGFTPKHSEVTAGMRYLHASRTVHQLINDRNRAVGLFLAVATLLWTASAALLNAKVETDIIIPMEKIKKWCLPVTFGTLAVLSLFVAFLLIRTRVGLIFEGAKMNALLGLPIGRVKRINPLSIFFIMHALVSMAGGVCAALFSVFMLKLAHLEDNQLLLPGSLIGVGVAALLLLLYVWTVSYTTSDSKLKQLQ